MSPYAQNHRRRLAGASASLATVSMATQANPSRSACLTAGSDSGPRRRTAADRFTSPSNRARVRSINPGTSCSCSIRAAAMMAKAADGGGIFVGLDFCSVGIGYSRTGGFVPCGQDCPPHRHTARLTWVKFLTRHGNRAAGCTSSGPTPTTGWPSSLSARALGAPPERRAPLHLPSQSRDQRPCAHPLDSLSAEIRLLIGGSTKALRPQPRRPYGAGYCLPDVVRRSLIARSHVVKHEG